MIVQILNFEFIVRLVCIGYYLHIKSEQLFIVTLIEFSIYVTFLHHKIIIQKLVKQIRQAMQKMEIVQISELEFELHERDLKDHSLRSYTTNDSPLSKRYLEIDTTSQGNDSVLDSQIEFSNECQQFFEEGYCLNGKNCPYEHNQKNYTQILNTDLAKKKIQVREQFADLLLVRFSRINSFLS